MVVVGIGGEPATGKTRLMREIIDRLGEPEPMTFRGARRKGKRVVNQTMRVEVVKDARTFVLGSYRDNDFDGTDRLSMAVQPLAVRFLRWVAKERSKWAIAFEGDRLFNEGFMNEALQLADLSWFVVLRAPDDELERRHRARADDQSERFLRSRRTKIENLRGRMELAEMTNESDEDLVRNAEQIVVFLRGGG